MSLAIALAWMVRVERVRIPGSDHFGVVADVGLLEPGAPDEEPADREDAEEGAEDASENGESSGGAEPARAVG